MIRRKVADGWEGIPVQTYKEDAESWSDVSRRVLFDSAESLFQARYFAIGPGGSTSLEEHRHEHFVLVLDGWGEVVLGPERTRIGPGDIVHVAPGVPHSFRNPGPGPFGILCVVDRERDRPRIIDPEAAQGRLTT
jgi:quercetin dioxygenase-like cupin family protein